MRKLQTFIVALSLGSPLAVTVACVRNSHDPSIALSKSIDPLVVNGTAYERSQLDLMGKGTIVIPENAVLEIVPCDKPCEVLIAKRLSVYAHPVEKITIVGKRHDMGCAVASRGDAIFVGTIGEYELPDHGGTSVELTFHIPEDIVVERRANLNGRKSMANMALNLDENTARAFASEAERNEASSFDWVRVTSVPDVSRAKDELMHARE
jgi:hypothetical protein